MLRWIPASNQMAESQPSPLLDSFAEACYGMDVNRYLTHPRKDPA